VQNGLRAVLCGVLFTLVGVACSAQQTAARPTAIGLEATSVGPALGVILDQNMRVLDIEADSTAARAGIQRGDILRAIGGTNIASPRATAELVRRSKIGQNLTITLERGGQQVSLPLVIGPRPGHPDQPTPTPVPNNEMYL
jgi:S1-C subfamily serine protease